jgi:signal transduction histidine kinase
MNCDREFEDAGDERIPRYGNVRVTPASERLLLASHLRSAVESIDQALAIFDANDILVLYNHAYRELVAENRVAPLIGKTYAELVDEWLAAIEFATPLAREQFRAARLACQRQASAEMDVRMRNGRTLRMRARRTAEGGTVETVWDVTDDERRASDLRNARDALEAATSAKSQFLSSVSHELRTPLNAILGFAHLLQFDKKEPLSDRHKERVLQILTGGEHLLHLIDDILDLSQIELGNVAVTLEAVHVHDVLLEVAEALRPIALRQDILVFVEPPLGGLAPVTADRARFIQILMNFGSNAIKYNRRRGRVTLTAESRTPEWVRVIVRDSGIGIPSEKHGQLFEPFQRAGQETGPIEGTGTGLAITRRLAALLQGEVGFESSVNVGSEFWVALPTVTPLRVG